MSVNLIEQIQYFLATDEGPVDGRVYTNYEDAQKAYEGLFLRSDIHPSLHEHISIHSKTVKKQLLTE